MSCYRTKWDINLSMQDLHDTLPHLPRKMAKDINFEWFLSPSKNIRYASVKYKSAWNCTSKPFFEEMSATVPRRYKIETLWDEVRHQFKLSGLPSTLPGKMAKDIYFERSVFPSTNIQFPSVEVIWQETVPRSHSLSKAAGTWGLICSLIV